jgi:hypothetical protein
MVKSPDTEAFKKLSLSQKEIMLINSLDGVSSTLVGMRLDKYVQDVIAALKAGRIDNAGEVFEKFDV